MSRTAGPSGHGPSGRDQSPDTVAAGATSRDLGRLDGRDRGRGGFKPERLDDLQRPPSVIPQIVGSESLPEPKGFTEIKIVGVGGAGNNALNRMIAARITGVEYVAVNTDPQALAQCEARVKLRIGRRAARQLGAGGDPATGERAAEDTLDGLQGAIAGADMVFIAAGMGGGTGTGAAPVIAALAQRQRALTVGVVSLPFTFEGRVRRRVAEEGLARLRACVDALIVIPNDRLLAIAGRNLSVVQAFRRADDMLRHGVQGIAELVTVTGLINLDFADVRAIMTGAGNTLMSIGEGSGPNRAAAAAEAAITSPLLDTSIEGARGILLNVTGGPDLSLHEVSEVAGRITESAHPDANILFGAVIAPRPEVELRVTLIATGMLERGGGSAPTRAARAPERRTDTAPAVQHRSRDHAPLSELGPEASPPPERGGPPPADGSDVPPFLRRGRGPTGGH